MPENETKTRRLEKMETQLAGMSLKVGNKLVWWVMGLFASLIASATGGWILTTNAARYEHVQRLSTVEEQVKTVDKRMEKVEVKIERVENRMGGIEDRMGKIETRQLAVEAKVDKMDGKLDEILKRMPK